MSAVSTHRRLPRSIRKHLRTQKASLRRQLSPEEAERAIEQLVRSFRRGERNPAAGPTDGKAPKKEAQTPPPSE